MKHSPINRKSKTPTAKMQGKCDKLLTPIIKSMHPVCLLNGQSEKCTYNTEVAHHHVHKSKSLILRYNLDNLIPLCHHCHLMLHHNESFWASKVVEIRGIEWFKDLEREKHKTIKADIIWYNNIYEELSKCIRSTSKI